MRYASDLKDFGDLIRATSEALHLPADAVEKDYYVVRALRALRDDLDGKFLFKGGTSLSKGWGIIDRFSEDIDLLFRSRHQQQDLSKGQVDRLLLRAKDIVGQTPGFTLINTNRSKGVSCSCSFSYPRQYKSIAAVGDTVLLEMGCRGGTQPSKFRTIRAFVTDFLQKRHQTTIAEDLTEFEVECLDVTRTFVEKLFAVSAAFAKNRAAGRTRHYYDLYKLAGLSEVRAFIESPAYVEAFDDVRRFSEMYWPGNVFPPERNAGKCEALAPNGADFQELKHNYARERDLFFQEPPTIGEILERLQRLPFPV